MNEIMFPYRPDESNIFACVFSTGKEVANVSTGAFESWNDANWDTYDIPLAEDNGGGVYWGNFPSAIAPGRYYVVVYQGTGATAPSLGRGQIIWNGTVEVPDAKIALETTVTGSPTSDAIFQLTAGSGTNKAYFNMVLTVTDISGNDYCSRRVTAYVGSTKQVTLDEDASFNVVAGDVVRIWANAYSDVADAAQANAIADAVWDEQRSLHNQAGSTGQKLNSIQRGIYL